MGQCIHYLKARFPTGQVEKVEPEFRRLLKDLADLEWKTFQKVRELVICSCEERLAELKRRHPTAFQVIDEEKIIDECRNRLTPALRKNGYPKGDEHMNCFGRNQVPNIHPEFDLGSEGCFLYLSAEVSDLADWRPFLDWLYARGATAAGWVDEHEMNGFEAVEMRGPSGERPIVVLTVYLDGGGNLQFHAGLEGDYDREITAEYGEQQEVIRQFWIDGVIEKESDHLEPYPVCGLGRTLEEESAAKSGRVRCKFCLKMVSKETAHAHQGEWVGQCCWDERLRATQ